MEAALAAWVALVEIVALAASAALAVHALELSSAWTPSVEVGLAGQAGHPWA